LQKLKIIPADIDLNPVDLVSSSPSSSRPSKRIKLEPLTQSLNNPNVEQTVGSPTIKREPQSPILTPLDFVHTSLEPVNPFANREPQSTVLRPLDHSHTDANPPAFVARELGGNYPNAQTHNPLPLRFQAPAGPTPSSRHTELTPDETYPNAQIHDPLPLRQRQTPAGPTPSSRHTASSGPAGNNPSSRIDLMRARTAAAREEKRRRAALANPDA
jgi:hypothetical protein